MQDVVAVEFRDPVSLRLGQSLHLGWHCGVEQRRELVIDRLAQVSSARIDLGECREGKVVWIAIQDERLDPIQCLIS